MAYYSSLLSSLLLVMTIASYSNSLPETCDVVLPVQIRPSQPPSPGSNVPTLEQYLQLLAGIGVPDNNITTCYNLTLLPGRHSFSAPAMAVSLPDTVISAESSPVLVEFGSAIASNSVLDIQNISYLEVRGITFLRSSGFLSFLNAGTILISSCVFRNFTQGALNIRNTRKLTITDTTFAGNGGLEASRLTGQQGGSGGLSVSYDNSLTHLTNATLTITNCMFARNNAESEEDVSLTPSEFSTAGSDFTGRGGALSLLFQSSTPVMAEIRDCRFINNVAEGYGGAVYILFKSKSSHTVNFISSRFIDNLADLTGGAIGIAHVSSSTVEDSRVNVQDCVFDSNDASYGGAVYFVATTNQSAEGRVGVVATFSNCSFANNNADNFGAAIGITALNLFSPKFQNSPVVVENCVFVHNSGRGGVLSVSYYPLVISGSNTLSNNTGPALLVLGAKVRVMGDTIFEGNNAVGKDGGALYVLSYGQLVFAQRGLKLIFNNNLGDLGASLVMEVPRTPKTYSTVLYNPLCPITHDQNRSSPLNWRRVSIGFNGNIAQVGAAIYTNRLALCSWTNNDAPFFNISRAFRWNFIKFGANNNRLKKGPLTAMDDQVQTQAVSIVVNGTINAYPGENSEINVVSLGELGQPTYTVWRFRQNSNTVRFDPQVYSSSNLTATSSSVPVSIYSNISLNEDDAFREDQPFINATVETLLTTDPSSSSIQLFLRDCPPGYLLRPWSNIASYDDCACNLERQEIMQCKGRQITLNGAYWARRDRSRSDQLLITTCPPGYCRCTISRETGVDSCHYVHNTGSNQICSCQREGVMCGVCRNSSFGVSTLLNKCTTCSDGFASLIALLIIADAVVIAVLLLIMIPFPDWLLPSVFYIQMLPFITEYFPVTFDKLSPYLYFISSASSLYFPYDFCLYSNMSALVSHTLRFIPLLTAVIVCPTVLLVRLMCIRRAMANPQSHHLMSRPVAWHGAWWIMVLCTTHNIHSALSVLRCPSLPNRRLGLQLRWFYDGSVQCFTGGHMGLVLLALSVLVVAVAMIPVSVILAKDFIKRVRFAHYLGEAFTSCYNEQVWWWSGVEQARRLIFLIFIVALPQNTYPALFLLMISVCVYGTVMPYKTRIANIMELVIASCIIVLLLIPNTTQLVEWLSNIPKQPPPSSTCQDEITGFTPLVILLGVLYYTPLVLTIGLCLVMGSIWAYLRIRNQLRKSRTENITNTRKKFSFIKRSRGFTQSEVAINDCQGASLNAETVRLAQQRTKPTSLRKKSSGQEYEMVEMTDSTKISDEEKSDVFMNSIDEVAECHEDTSCSSSSGSEQITTV